MESADILLKHFPGESRSLGRHFASIFARWAEGFDRKREMARKRRRDYKVPECAFGISSISKR
jgi:hypothetical protein